MLNRQVKCACVLSHEHPSPCGVRAEALLSRAEIRCCKHRLFGCHVSSTKEVGLSVSYMQSIVNLIISFGNISIF